MTALQIAENSGKYAVMMLLKDYKHRNEKKKKIADTRAYIMQITSYNELYKEIRDREELRKSWAVLSCLILQSSGNNGPAVY